MSKVSIVIIIAMWLVQDLRNGIFHTYLIYIMQSLKL